MTKWQASLNISEGGFVVCKTIYLQYITGTSAPKKLKMYFVGSDSIVWCGCRLQTAKHPWFYSCQRPSLEPESNGSVVADWKIWQSCKNKELTLNKQWFLHTYLGRECYCANLKISALYVRRYVTVSQCVCCMSVVWVQGCPARN